MNNSDMPAMPQTIEPSENLERQSQSLGLECNSTHYLGLTKREHFAGLAPEMPNWFINSYRHVNTEAAFFAWRTYYADALLKELDK